MQIHTLQYLVIINILLGKSFYIHQMSIQPNYTENYLSSTTQFGK